MLSDLRVAFGSSLNSAVESVRRGDLSALAIDMPIGLLDERPRAADREARALLGPRRSSVFPTPVRATIGAVDYLDACERSRAASGKALSKQAFNLLPKIIELDELIRPQDQDHVVEAHPELAFMRLAGSHLTHPKRTAEGKSCRLALLNATFGAPAVAAALRSRVAPDLDVIDALGNLVTAAHVARGTERRLGHDIDSTGKRAQVVY